MFLLFAILRTTFFGQGIPSGFVYIGWLLCVTGLVLLMLNTERVEQVLDSLIFNKASSASGYERGLWARYGFKTFNAVSYTHLHLPTISSV